MLLHVPWKTCMVYTRFILPSLFKPRKIASYTRFILDLSSLYTSASIYSRNNRYTRFILGKIYSIYPRYILDIYSINICEPRVAMMASIYRVFIEYISSIFTVPPKKVSSGYTSSIYRKKHCEYILDTYSIYTRYILDAYPPREYLSSIYRVCIEDVRSMSLVVQSVV